MSEIKRRGRPRNDESPKTKDADRVIGLSVHTLLHWGYPLRSRGLRPGVCEVVALKSAAILQRVDNHKRALGPDRIEQIYEAWFASENSNRQAARRFKLCKASRYTKDSLTESIPSRGAGLEGLTANLLSNGGRWVGIRPPFPSGDRVLVPKEQERLGNLSDRAVDLLVQRLVRLWIEKNGHPTPAMMDVLEKIYYRSVGLAYRADALGSAPDSLKNGVEK